MRRTDKLIFHEPLVDTGPLYALVDAKGRTENCRRSRAVLGHLGLPLLTTWSAITLQKGLVYNGRQFSFGVNGERNRKQGRPPIASETPVPGR